MSQPQPDDDEIRKMLIQLHDELQQTPSESLNQEEKDLLRHLMKDIQAMLDRPVESHAAGAQIYPANETIVDRLEQSVDLLQVTHPTLSAAIRKVLDTLNIAGI